MSLILDALNRAEQERSEKNHIPSLQSMHGSTEVARPSLLQRLHLERWLIVLVVAYLAFDYFRDQPASSTPAPAPVATTVKAPAATPEAVQKPQVVQKPQAEMAAAPAPEPVPAPEPKPESMPESMPAPASPAASSREVESLYTAPPKDPAGSVVVSKAQPAMDDTAPLATQAASSERQQAYVRTEEITQLPMDFRQQIPSLKYGDHIPSTEPGDSRVVLNGTVYKEGDQLAPGLVLKGISEQGIILEFQSTQFRLEAYNSWINFQ